MNLNGTHFEKLILKLLKPVIILTWYVQPDETMAIDKYLGSSLAFDFLNKVTLIWDYHQYNAYFSNHKVNWTQFF